MTADLASWLLEQITEDERRAKNVGAEGLAGAVLPGQGGRVPGPRWDAQHGVVADVRDQLPLWMVDGVPWAKYATSSFVAEHIATWDPERVLAECDAKRQMIAFALDDQGDYGLARANSLIEGEYDDDMELPARLLRLLALPYADREGYREEWRP